MKITILCEGKTEKAFKPCLHKFLKSRLEGTMPALQFDKHDGPIPKGDELRRTVDNLLSSGRKPADVVIALTDLYTGSQPPEFANAADAKAKMRAWVGNEPRFHPHVALHDFEAWLLPYWDRIQKLAGRQGNPFGTEPEKINHNKPPAHRLAEFFEAGSCRDSYRKPRDAARILKDVDLMVSIEACPELKKLVNTILKLCGGTKAVIA